MIHEKDDFRKGSPDERRKKVQGERLLILRLVVSWQQKLADSVCALRLPGRLLHDVHLLLIRSGFVVRTDVGHSLVKLRVSHILFISVRGFDRI